MDILRVKISDLPLLPSIPNDGDVLIPVDLQRAGSIETYALNADLLSETISDNLTTSDIPEGNRLYYTEARVTNNTTVQNHTLRLNQLGTAANLNFGTAANNLVRLDTNARLPAIDGSNLTNLPNKGRKLFNNGTPLQDRNGLNFINFNVVDNQTNDRTDVSISIDVSSTVTTSSFTQPVLNSNVTVSLREVAWINPTQYIFIVGGGTYEVVSISNKTLTIKNIDSNNTAAGTVIATGAKVNTAGRPGSGVAGASSFSRTTSSFIMPAVNNAVTISLLNSTWTSEGQYLLIEDAGHFIVDNIVSNTSITIRNLGYPENVAASTTITTDRRVVVSAARGLNGYAGFTNTTASFTQPAVNADINISGLDFRAFVAGQGIYIEGAGSYRVVNKLSNTQLRIKNLGIDSQSPGTVISTNKLVTAAGVAGPQGEKGDTGNTGALGATGPQGAKGDSGVPASTRTSAAYTQPGVNTLVTVSVLDSSWIPIGSIIFIEAGGYYLVVNIISSTSISIRNLGYPDNGAVGSIISTNRRVSPSGMRGAQGPKGIDGSNGSTDLTPFTELTFTPRTTNAPTAPTNKVSLFSKGNNLYLIDDEGRLTIYSPFSVNTESLTTDKTLVLDSAIYQYLNPGALDRDIVLPTPGAEPLRFVIRNIGPSKDLRLKETASDAPFQVLGNSTGYMQAELIFDGLAWRTTVI